jgi:prepilin-type processing-associated H-X9-DG protein
MIEHDRTGRVWVRGRRSQRRLNSESTTGASPIRLSRHKRYGDKNIRVATGVLDHLALPCVGARRTVPRPVRAYNSGEYRATREHRPCQLHWAVANAAQWFDPMLFITSEARILRNPPMKRQPKQAGCDGPTLYRHNEMANLAFYDGHVAAMRKDKVWIADDYDNHPYNPGMWAVKFDMWMKNGGTR